MIFSPLIILIVVIVGVLIGGVGVGGVLLVPSLKYLGGIPLHTAIPACMVSYMMTGLIGTIIFARNGSINWALALWVCLGALPGAYLGAWLLPDINEPVLEVGIAILLLASGFNALISRSAASESTQIGSAVLLVVGFISGVGSALSGTGGPLVLIPLLVWLKVPMLTAIGLSQAIQVPVSVIATIGNTIHGSVDWRLSLFLTVVIAGGVIIGAKTVHKTPVALVKRFVACLLIIVGVMLLLKLTG